MCHQRSGRAGMHWTEGSIISGWASMVAHCCQAQVECLGRDQSCKPDRIPCMRVSTFDSCDIPDGLRRTELFIVSKCGYLLIVLLRKLLA
jgi:hypothetical protein